uniref:Uncharacterized protein n=1 Tax=Timema bartmani TaxID=61472 RepID=A0A7R9FAV2_9NEOP|nr:unnamed protein product [Timema bartmani]
MHFHIYIGLLLPIFVNIIVNSKNDVPRFNSEKDFEQMIEQGRREYNLIQERVGMPKFGSCWENAVLYLKEGCGGLTEQLQSDIALQFTDCFLIMSGMQPYRCEKLGSNREFCLRNMSDKAFQAYTQFYTHTQNICFFLQNIMWHDATHKTIDRLSLTSKHVAEQLEQAEKVQTSLLEHQKESMSVQIELLYNGRMLGQIMENSQIKLLTVMNEFRASTVEQKQLLFDVFERLSSLQAWVLGEVSWLETVIFYISSAIISYVSTATPRTHSARPGLFVTVTMNAVIEHSICTHLIGEGTEQLDTINVNLSWWVWFARRIMIVVCVALLVIAMYNYSDYHAINHRLLVQIQQQNSKIIGQLKNIKSSKIYSMDYIGNKYNIDESYYDSETSKLSTSSKHDCKDPDQKLNCITLELRNTALERDDNKDLGWNPLQFSESGAGPSPRQTINRLVTIISAMVCACAAQEGEKMVTKRGLAGIGYGYVPALSYGPAHSYSNQHSLSYAAPLAYSKVIVAAPAVSTVSYHGNYGNGLGYGVHGLGYGGYGLGYSGHGLGYGGYGHYY